MQMARRSTRSVTLRRAGYQPQVWLSEATIIYEIGQTQTPTLQKIITIFAACFKMGFEQG